MTNHNFEQSLLRDALSEVARKERRSLLGISLFGITLKIGGMVPSKIPSLGIEFQLANQQALLLIVASIILYFIVAFIIYAASDYLSWKLEIKSWALEKAVSENEEVYHIIALSLVHVKKRLKETWGNCIKSIASTLDWSLRHLLCVHSLTLGFRLLSVRLRYSFLYEPQMGIASNHTILSDVKGRQSFMFA